MASPTAEIPTQLPVQSAAALPWFERIATDWFGQPLDALPSFRLVWHPGEALEFLATARKVPAGTIGSPPGGFHEGLWQHDCAELFLAHPDSGHYLEFNLAPNGAWWSCLFEAPRISALVENLPLPGVHAEGLEGTAHWEARLRIPLAALPPEIGADPTRWRANVAFCLGNAPRQRFATFAPPGEGSPDFHRPARWLPLALPRP